MIEGKYPNYNSVIPRNSSIAVAVNRTAFEKALKRVKVFSNKTSNFIRLDIAVDSMTISSQDLDFSISAHEVISSTSNEEGFIGFDSNKLLLCLQSRTEEIIQLHFNDAQHAALILSDESEDETTILIMPQLIQS
jgi:DNA polymerase-3 subunit beta